MGLYGGVQEFEAVAKSVNLTPAQVVEQLRSGKTLADIAKAQNVDEATVKQAIVDARNAEIDQAVQFGFLTQDQGNQLKQQNTVDNVNLNSYSWFGLRMWH